MNYNYNQLEKLVLESNKIEGINTAYFQEVQEYERFLALDEVTISDVEKFVSIFQPGAKLRATSGLSVYIGNHQPIAGGMQVVYKLEGLLNKMNDGVLNAFEAHVEYEILHPFTDGNGRSGRVLWTWMMQRERPHWIKDLGFLHSFYYQTLASRQEKVGYDLMLDRI